MDQERPIVRIRAGVQGDRLKSTRKFRPPPKPSPAQQAVRLTPTVERRLSDVISGRVNVVADPKGLATDRALVLEIAGAVGNFRAAAERVGLEWLAEEITRIELDARMAAALGKLGEEDEDDFDYFQDDDDILEAFLDEEAERPVIAGRLYFGMPTLEAFKKILNLWKKYKVNEKAPPGHGDWWQLFSYLNDLRSWGPEDRISPASRMSFEQILRENPSGPVKIEVDLWFRGKSEDRETAFEEFVARLSEIGGELLDHAAIEEIHYHAALISLPASQVRRLTQLTSSLAFANEIMSIAPQGILSGKSGATTGVAAPRRPQIPDEPDRRPEIVALLDGYPILEHHWLKNRISITEVDVPARIAPVNQRSHGTQMASLILHGDIAENGPSLDRTLKVVPILVPVQGQSETNPSDKLLIAVIFRAITKLKNDNPEESAAPEVLIVNHSLGVEGVQFAQAMSPWARMLDYLAYKKKILFIVSSGNIKTTFEVPGYTDPVSFSIAHPAKRQRNIILGLEASKARRAMLTPAEQLNGLTVAATHADGSTTPLPRNSVNPFERFRLANLCSGVGLGFRRTIKPDVAAPGGRLIALPIGTNPFSVHGHHAEQLGQLAAAPDVHGASLGITRRSAGTSNAAALTTRAAVQVADALDVAFQGEPDHWRDLDTSAVMLKALVAHSARWGDAGAFLEGLLPQDWRARRENVTRHLGFGEIDPDRVLSGTTHRITLLGEGLIRTGRRHPYFVPLPRELSAKKDVRSIVVTLAWMSPIAPGNQNYRKLGLELVAEVRGQAFWNGVERAKSIQPPGHLGREGTLIHTIYRGDNALPITTQDGVTFNVQASRPRMSGVTKTDIPYALAVTVEVEDTLNADVYQSIRNRLRLRSRT